ncbi:DUF4297 domain-containing protein, partial [bacterium]
MLPTSSMSNHQAGLGALAIPDRADPGDETFRRFRYQATHAAILAVGLLQESTDVDEVYCEQYEDVLLRLKSGQFRGVQVKTRNDGAEPLRATDESILDALVKFVELDLAHPGMFDGFTLATNGAFDRAGKGHGNLNAVVLQARNRAGDPTAPCPRALALAKTIVARFKKKNGAKTKSRIAKAKKKTHKASDDVEAISSAPVGIMLEPRLPTEGEILRCLARIDLTDALPKLPDIRNRLRDRLIELSSKVRKSILSVADRVVDALEYAAYLASSRADEDRNGRLWFVSDPEKRAAMAISDELKGKLISKDMVRAAIDRHCSAALLVSASPVRPEDIPQDLSLLKKKLVAGGLSLATISMAHDAIASVEEFGTRLLYL